MANPQWIIQGEEKKKFETIFESLGPVGGKLPGDRVKPVLLNSKLSTDILGQVWELSDIDKDGFLDKDEFSVAMHLVYKALDREPVPSILPQELVPPSKRKPALVGAVAVLPPISQISPKHVGAQKPSSTADVLINTMSPTIQNPTSPTGLYINGYVPDVEIQRFSTIFTQKADLEGYIGGVEARDVFVQSGLPQPILAHVWNICDQKQVGKLNKDQFILAMHFISQKVKGVEVPSQLPPKVTSLKGRDSGLGDSGNLSDSSSGVGDFSAVKELDALNREIEELRQEKDTLTREIDEKKSIIQSKSNEVQELQNTLDRAGTSLSQLESDKAEAHTRIDELDQQQLKLDHMIAHVRGKIEEETRAIAALQSQIKSQELANKRQEEEYSKAKMELENLKKEESQLQQNLEIGEQQLQNITKQVSDTENEIAKVKEQIASLADQKKGVTSNIEQYDKAVVALRNETEVTDNQILKMESENFAPFNVNPQKSESPFSANNAFGNTETQGANGVQKTENNDFAAAFDTMNSKNDDDVFSMKNDFFSAETTFKSASFEGDPFAGSDPFESTSPVSWGEKNNPNSADKFTVTFDDTNTSSLFNETEDVKAKTTGGDDPWAAFGAAPEASSSASSDPFGKDAFGSSVVSNEGFDQAFGNNFNVQSNTNNNSKLKLPMDALLDSEGERKRKEQQKIQEQKDYELALKLSKEM